MAPHNAGAAGIRLCVSDGYVPTAEAGNPLFDKPLLRRRMGVVAGLARTPLVGFVDVQIVQIIVTVAEAGEGIRAAVVGHLAGVARETEGKVILLVAQVQRLGIGIPQKLREGGPVRVMTVAALSPRHGLVN